MAGDEESTAADAYDEFAATYTEEVESSPYNADLEFPGTTDLIPDVSGKRILDAGCGTGAYTEWLLEQGAEVVGVDASEGMLDRARERVGDRARFRQVDLEDSLDFADESFDGVVSALVLGYIADWEAVFSEFARLLEPGGFVVVSTKHPFDEFPLGADENYFEVERKTTDWSVEIPYYRRPLAAILNPVIEAGFRIDEIAEPQPTTRFEARWPERYQKESKRPVFLGVRGIKRNV